MIDSKQITLPVWLQEKVINLPETGMGYHIVDVYMKSGEKIQHLHILNSTFLVVPTGIDINENEIIDIQIACD